MIIYFHSIQNLKICLSFSVDPVNVCRMTAIGYLTIYIQFVDLVSSLKFIFWAMVWRSYDQFNQFYVISGLFFVLGIDRVHL